MNRHNPRPARQALRIREEFLWLSLLMMLVLVVASALQGLVHQWTR